MCSGQQVPANLEMLLRSMSNKTHANEMVNEDAFSDGEVNALRSAVTRSQERVHSISPERKKYLSDMLTKLEDSKKKFKNNDLANKLFAARFGRTIEGINSSISPTIQYEDYNLSPGGIGKKSPISNLRDPNYSMATTIGRAKYQPDENGNLHVIDTYDFPRAEKTKKLNLQGKLARALTPNDSGMGWNPLFQAAHVLGEEFSKPMKMDIQLQYGANGEF